jgi:drug/metabolite transporter (DMT)-like permease
MWILVALAGYLFLAFSQVLDKFLLTEERIPKPAVYAFYVSLFSAFTFFFSIFGLRLLPLPDLGLFLVAGLLFTYSLLAFYYAVRDYDVARVSPLFGLFTTLTVVGFAFLLPEFFGEPKASWQLLWALALFIFGGLLISYDLPFTKKDHLPVTVVLAGFCMGMYLLLLKVGYAKADFVNGLVWSRVGAFLGAFTLLLIPTFRHQIFSHEKKNKEHQGKKKNLGTLGLFVFNKAAAGAGSFFILYAVSIGSTSFVQALNGMQFVFLLLLTIPFARRFPDIFHSELSWSDWMQKIFALVLIFLGFYFLALSGLPIK